jgi:hypothetical protein
MHPLLIKGFPRVPRMQQEVTCLGDINVTNKTTKTTFICISVTHAIGANVNWLPV